MFALRNMYLKKLSFCIIITLSTIFSQKNPNFAPDKAVIVHLFEWKWNDIADECESFLSKKGYGAVQVSPPNENLIITLDGNKRPWYERYQPISYKLITRSGNESEFVDMINRCNSVGVRIYVDAVLNHMTAGKGVGTGGSIGNHDMGLYPNVPYNSSDFHPLCSINNYNDATNVRNCELVGLRDLNQTSLYVQSKLIEYMNHLVDLGVAGFRIDAAKHMWPNDLEVIYSSLQNLSVEHGFAPYSRPFIYQEINGIGSEAVTRNQYVHLGAVVEFKYAFDLSKSFRGESALKYLVTFGPKWGFVASGDAVPFVDNHDTQRDSNSLTYKSAKQYKMAVAYMLAHPYGQPRVMSSFQFDNSEQGPPQDANGEIVSPIFNSDLSCSGKWICEHRWRQIYNMVEFRRITAGTSIDWWWTDENQQIAFSRGSKGFIAFTNWGDINSDIRTGLSSGTYCDIISGSKINGICTGKQIYIGSDQKAHIQLKGDEFDGVIATHINAKI